MAWIATYVASSPYSLGFIFSKQTKQQCFRKICDFFFIIKKMSGLNEALFYCAYTLHLSTWSALLFKDAVPLLGEVMILASHYILGLGMPLTTTYCYALDEINFHPA